MVVVGTREISRDEANEMLLRVDDVHQRNRTDGRVERYRRDDDLAPATNPIAFDGKGRLINGQHNLAAFAGSNREKLLILWEINLHPKAYLGFDHNKTRKPADTLKWHGIERAGEISAPAS